VSVKKAKENAKKETLLWVFIFLLTVTGIFANSYFSAVALPIRAAVGIVLAAVIFTLVRYTQKGDLAWVFIKGSRNELRKVVWPTKQETTQMTLLVVVMVVVVALILWGVDAFFFWLIKSISA